MTREPTPAAGWVLGVDGGGTKTELALASAAGQVIGPFRAPGSNPFDADDWRQHLLSLFASADLPERHVVHGGLGLAGYGDTPAISDQLTAFVTRHLPFPVTLDNDVAMAFRGAFAGGVGVLLLAGTGSMAWACNPQGCSRVGGLGHELGDEGSAYWIGQLALKRLAAVLDGRAAGTAFTRTLAAELGVHDVAGLIVWWGEGHRRSRIASVAELTAALAQGGDPEATELLAAAVQELALLAGAARSKARLGPGAPLALAGGLFRSAIMRDLTERRLGDEFQLREPLAGPLAGALHLAAERAGWRPQEAWLRQVDAALEAAR